MSSRRQYLTATEDKQIHQTVWLVPHRKRQTRVYDKSDGEGRICLEIYA
jgi:hypothetical protein